jgi:hypothetical protein
MNQGSNGFVETAFLLGLAHEFDTRNIVADDIDANGLVDLLIVEHGVGRPANLQIWKNYGEDTGNWIGVAISDQPSALTPGTTVRVRTKTTDQMAHVVNGDSFNSQHAATLHFGLGNLTHVDAIEITRPNGGTETIRNLQAGKYHVVGGIANGN